MSLSPNFCKLEMTVLRVHCEDDEFLCSWGKYIKWPLSLNCFSFSFHLCLGHIQKQAFRYAHQQNNRCVCGVMDTPSLGNSVEVSLSISPFHYQHPCKCSLSPCTAKGSVVFCFGDHDSHEEQWTRQGQQWCAVNRIEETQGFLELRIC